MEKFNLLLLMSVKLVGFEAYWKGPVTCQGRGDVDRIGVSVKGCRSKEEVLALSARVLDLVTGAGRQKLNFEKSLEKTERGYPLDEMSVIRIEAWANGVSVPVTMEDPTPISPGSVYEIVISNEKRGIQASYHRKKSLPSDSEHGIGF